jgi:hypothetical protein
MQSLCYAPEEGWTGPSNYDVAEPPAEAKKKSLKQLVLIVHHRSRSFIIVRDRSSSFQKCVILFVFLLKWTTACNTDDKIHAGSSKATNTQTLTCSVLMSRTNHESRVL